MLYEVSRQLLNQCAVTDRHTVGCTEKRRGCPTNSVDDLLVGTRFVFFVKHFVPRCGVNLTLMALIVDKS